MIKDVIQKCNKQTNSALPAFTGRDFFSYFALQFHYFYLCMGIQNLSHLLLMIMSLCPWCLTTVSRTLCWEAFWLKCKVKMLEINKYGNPAWIRVIKTILGGAVCAGSGATDELLLPRLCWLLLPRKEAGNVLFCFLFLGFLGLVEEIPTPGPVTGFGL